MGEAWEEKENFFPPVLSNLYFVELSPYEITSAFLSQSHRNSVDNIYRKQKSSLLKFHKYELSGKSMVMDMTKVVR